MSPKTFLAVSLALMFGFADIATAQAPRPDEPRGTVPPGSAVDGSRPSDGAIKGGSILPGEVGGAPGSGRGPTTPDPTSKSRCDTLSGTLREQCRAQEQGASSGPTREPRTDPPPQTPR
jgi:hypothetical protein